MENPLSQLDPHTIKQICQRYERELVSAKDWMFWFLMLWTAALLAMEWMHFLFGRSVPHTLSAGYIVLLGTYIAHKEVLRWTGIRPQIRRGELFVYIWWGMYLAMFLVEYLWGTFHIQEGMATLSYEVLGYFLVTEVSKAVNTWRSLKKGNPPSHKASAGSIPAAVHDDSRAVIEK